MWHSAGIYPQLNRMSWDAMTLSARACSEAALQVPSFMRNPRGEFDQFEIPHFGRRSGPWCAALMSAVLVWSQKIMADNDLPDSLLLAAAYDGLKMWAALFPEETAAKRLNKRTTARKL